MEIQPPSSIDQATSLFTGLTENQVANSISRTYPLRPINTSILSKNALEAVSSTNSTNDFRQKDMIEANRLLQGVITNPWSSVREIEQGKTDPFYYDAGLSDIRDLEQNRIGTVTGAPDVQDPRLSFVENLLKLKTFQRGVDNDLRHDYLKNLFLTQVENGSTYYQNQLQRQMEALQQKVDLEITTRPPISETVILKNVSTPAKPAERPKKRAMLLPSNPMTPHSGSRNRLEQLRNRFSETRAAIDARNRQNTNVQSSNPDPINQLNIPSVINLLPSEALATSTDSNPIANGIPGTVLNSTPVQNVWGLGNNYQLTSYTDYYTNSGRNMYNQIQMSLLDSETLNIDPAHRAAISSDFRVHSDLPSTLEPGVQAPYDDEEEDITENSLITPQNRKRQSTEQSRMVLAVQAMNTQLDQMIQNLDKDEQITIQKLWDRISPEFKQKILQNIMRPTYRNILATIGNVIGVDVTPMSQQKPSIVKNIPSHNKVKTNIRFMMKNIPDNLSTYDLSTDEKILQEFDETIDQIRTPNKFVTPKKRELSGVKTRSKKPKLINTENYTPENYKKKIAETKKGAKNILFSSPGFSPIKTDESISNILALNNEFLTSGDSKYPF